MDHLTHHEDELYSTRVVLSLVLAASAVAVIVAVLWPLTGVTLHRTVQPLYCSQGESQLDSHCAQVCQISADALAIDADCWVSCTGACGY